MDSTRTNSLPQRFTPTSGTDGTHSNDARLSITGSCHGLFHGSSKRENLQNDCGISIHIRLATQSSSEASPKAHDAPGKSDPSKPGGIGAGLIERICIKAKDQVEKYIVDSEINDVSHTFPTFSEREIIPGHFLGRGSIGQVSQISGFRIKGHDHDVGEKADEPKLLAPLS